MWSRGLRFKLLPVRSAIGLRITVNGFSNVSMMVLIVLGSSVGTDI